MTAAPEYPGVPPADERSPSQVAHEAAMQEVSDTLLNIEQAIRRTERARRAVALGGREPTIEVVLAATSAQLEAARRELFQSAYFSGDQQRLL